MTFEIKPIDRKTFDEIWTPEIAQQLDIEYIRQTADWADDFSLSRMTWAIDKNKRACLIWVTSGDRLDGTRRYALVMNGEYALIAEQGYRTYAFTLVSEKFKNKLDQVKEMISEALILGGEFLNVGQPLSDLSIIKSVQFINE